MTLAERLAAAADRLCEISEDRSRAWRLGMAPNFSATENIAAHKEFDEALAAYRESKS